MEYKYTGIIIGKRDVGETDRIYSLYTLEGGKIQALAKGVRKPQAKLAGSLENFTLADITVMRSRGMGKITGSIVENSHAFLKKDYDTLVNALQSMHVFNRLVDLEHHDGRVFVLLQEYLTVTNELARKAPAAEELFHLGVLLRLGFLFKLLNALGYTLAVSVCVGCGEKLLAADVHFSAEHGGVACTSCRQEMKNTVKISANTVKLLRFFAQRNLSLLPKLKIARQDLLLAQHALQDFLRWV